MGCRLLVRMGSRTQEDDCQREAAQGGGSARCNFGHAGIRPRAGTRHLQRAGLRPGASGAGRQDALPGVVRFLPLPPRQHGAGRRRPVRRRGDKSGGAGPPRCQLDGGPGLAPGQPSQALEAEPGGARCRQLYRGLQLPVPHDDQRPGPDPPGAPGPHRHRHDPGDPGAVPARPNHGCSRRWLSCRRWSSASCAITPRCCCPGSPRPTRSST